MQYSEGLTYRLNIIKDGLRKYRLYFLKAGEKIPLNHAQVQENNLPFILFSQKKEREEGICILGMYVSAELRGTYFTDMMLSRFFQLMQNSGKTLASTGQIKKPFLAAKLVKIGFIPERSDMIARIIGSDEQNIPTVVIEKNLRGNGTIPKNKSVT